MTTTMGDFATEPCPTCKGRGWVECDCVRCSSRRCKVFGPDHFPTTCWDCHGRGELPVGCSITQMGDAA